MDNPVVLDMDGTDIGGSLPGEKCHTEKLVEVVRGEVLDTKAAFLGECEGEVGASQLGKNR